MIFRASKISELRRKIKAIQEIFGGIELRMTGFVDKDEYCYDEQVDIETLTVSKTFIVTTSYPIDKTNVHTMSFKVSQSN